MMFLMKAILLILASLSSSWVAAFTQTPGPPPDGVTFLDFEDLIGNFPPTDQQYESLGVQFLATNTMFQTAPSTLPAVTVGAQRWTSNAPSTLTDPCGGAMSVPHGLCANSNCNGAIVAHFVDPLTGQPAPTNFVRSGVVAGPRCGSGLLDPMSPTVALAAYDVNGTLIAVDGPLGNIDASFRYFYMEHKDIPIYSVLMISGNAQDAWDDFQFLPPESDQPSAMPSWSPTQSPSAEPSLEPSYIPTVEPSLEPSYIVTDEPSVSPPKGPTPEPPCFSGNNIVQVKGKGPTRMDTLKVGDFVSTKDGVFSKVYSFGHLHREIWVEFLQINSSLEITPEHFLYTQQSGLLPAGKVKVGDALVTAQGTEQVVHSIRKVIRRGLYAPFTENGSITVSGVVASCYIRFPEGPVQKYLLFATQDWMQHSALAPIRAFCALLGCENETHHASTGYSKPVSFWMKLVAFGAAVESEMGLWCFLHFLALPILWLFANAKSCVIGLLGVYLFWNNKNKTASKRQKPPSKAIPPFTEES